MKRPTVALLFGGRSPEYEVSCRSAAAIRDALLTAGYDVLPLGISREGTWFLFRGSPDRIYNATWENTPGLTQIWFGEGGSFFTDNGRLLRPDVVFPAVHGTYCEDGRLQGFLDTWRIPYVGCGVECSVLAMNKLLAKQAARSIGIPTLPETPITRETPVHELTETLRFPLFLKPARSGSSFGASPVLSPGALPAALDSAFREDSLLLAEPLVRAREIEVAVFDDGTPRASRPGEILTDSDFYDYDTKYLRGSTRLAIPAPLDESEQHLLMDASLSLFRHLGCRHLARVDFFKTEEGVFFNEINTMPGFTSDSMYPRLWEHEGVDLPLLCRRLVERALSC